MSEPDDYLQEGFDPYTLTVPRLRSILVTHDVKYSASDKKSQLIDIFNTKIVPQAPRILAQRARARRTSRGIVDADSQSSTQESDVTDLPPPTRRGVSAGRRSRSPRKASRRLEVQHTHEDNDDDQGSAAAVVQPTPRRAGGRKSRSVSQQASVPDEAANNGNNIHRTRRIGAPKINSEPPDDGVDIHEGGHDTPFARRDDVGDCSFSNENPFQRGSTSPQAPKSARRKTVDPSRTATAPLSARRRTEGPTTTSAVHQIPAVTRRLVSHTPEMTHEPEPEPLPVIEAGEEFTPEEQLELTMELARSRELAAARGDGGGGGGGGGDGRSHTLTTALSALLVAILGAYAAWYRHEKLAVGYCGMGSEPQHIIPDNLPFVVPDWAANLVEPRCEPCPLHAYCYADFVARCETDYLLRPHPLSLGGLVPLRPTCEPDGEKVRKVKVVADKAVEELRERRAKHECGILVDDDGVKEDSPAIGPDRLRDAVAKKKNKRMSGREFDDLWAAAIGEIEAREEVETVTFNSTSDPAAVPDTVLTSTSLARLPLSCAIRRSLRLGLERHRFPLGSVILLGLIALYARARYRRHVAVTAQVPALVDKVLSRLAQQRELGEDGVDDPWLFLPNLRDDVLRSVHSLAEREKIWNRVRRVVDQNSNVRTGQRESRSGEVGRAWEWIGTVEGMADRRRSGRTSWGADVKVKEEDADNVLPGWAPDSLRWDERRPAF